MDKRKRSLGWASTEILISISIVAVLTAGVLTRSQALDKSTTAQRVVDEMVTLRDAIRAAYAGRADYNGLAADWPMLASRLPSSMVVLDANNRPIGLRNATGGAILVRVNANPAYAALDASVVDSNGDMCSGVLAGLFPAFERVLVNPLGNKNITDSSIPPKSQPSQTNLQTICDTAGASTPPYTVSLLL